ncbi:MAG: rhodanese-like domain-containing protein [Campylobacterota bacterium]|nr:rhodanese-like domain-containing protein [Campylobacterota bacterium]
MSSLSIVLTGVITGCDSSSSTGTNNIVVQDASDYATRSSADFNQNSYGLISATKAAKMITDWENNKPEGKRKLIIMQVGNIYGFEGTHQEPNPVDGSMMDMPNGYIKSDADKNVYVFDRTAGCTSATVEESRGDGVSAIPKPVFTIEEMDMAFSTYGIDPNQDVLMLVLAEGSGSYMAGAARMWYTMTYWGFPQEGIMMLNGQASNVLNPDVNSEIAALGITHDDLFTAEPSQYPMMLGQTLVKGEDWDSVSNIKRDGTYLQATMEDMMDLVTANTGTDLILDARSDAEYEGSKKAKTEYTTCGESKDQQCYTAFDGHIKGAVNLYYTDVVKTDDASEDINGDGEIDAKDATYSWKSLEALDNIFANAGYDAGDTVYTYCRTGTKASLLTFTSAAVLGYPTRMYDGSWIQWGKMANTTDTNANELLPSDSRWLTVDYSESVIMQPDNTVVSPITQAFFNAYAENTNAMIDEDKAAK